VIGVHSFTPILGGVKRPMHAGILFRASEKFGHEILADLRRDASFDVAENAPYRRRLDHSDPRRAAWIGCLTASRTLGHG
jgi:predicted N-formylglutamate amidohydrolase